MLKDTYSGAAFDLLFIVYVWSLRSIGCIIHFMRVAPLYGSYISVKWGDISGWWITMLGSGLWLSWRWVWMVDMSAFHGACQKWCTNQDYTLSTANIYNENDVWARVLSFECHLNLNGCTAEKKGQCALYFSRKQTSRQTYAIFIDFLWSSTVPNMWT